MVAVGLWCVRWFAAHSHGVLDTVFLVLAQFGTELFFFPLLFFLYWFRSRRHGRELLWLYAAALYSALFLGLWFHVPHPPEVYWKVPAVGYSFPSVEMVVSSALWTGLALHLRVRWVRPFAIAMVGLVALAQLYLGIHTIWDVLAGGAFGFALAILAIRLVGHVRSFFAQLDDAKRRLYLLMLPALAAAAYLVLFELVDASVSVLPLIARPIGFILGLAIAYGLLGLSQRSRCMDVPRLSDGQIVRWYLIGVALVGCCYLGPLVVLTRCGGAADLSYRAAVDVFRSALAFIVLIHVFPWMVSDRGRGRLAGDSVSGAK